MHFSTLAALTAIRLVCITSSAICCHARPPVREIAAYRVALWRVGILGPTDTASILLTESNAEFSVWS
jgi:hypothetical protein